METAPTAKEIIEIMKTACEALKQFNKKHPKVNLCDKTERDLELWSSNLHVHANTLNGRIIYK